MVDEPGEISALGRIHDVVGVDPEEVTGSDALLLVTLLSHVREDGPHVVPDVLDDHLVGGNVLEGEEAPIVNGRFSEGHLLPTELKWAKENCVSDESVAAAFHESIFGQRTLSWLNESRLDPMASSPSTVSCLL